MLDHILTKEMLTKEDLLTLMRLTEQKDLEQLYASAYAVKERYVGRKAYFRGLIEFSNECVKNCYYCGIRSGNEAVERFCMTKKEIVEMAKWAYENQYGSVTLQSGERKDPRFESFVSDVVEEIKTIDGGKLGITLSLGEQSEETYQKWFDKGAHRYLLRIETSNESLFKKIHPDNKLHSFDERVNCLHTLKNVGFQVGTGIMIGLPGQTEDDLVNDILFFEKMGIGMIGMGPYVVHKDTPLGKEAMEQGKDTEIEKQRRFTLGLKMVAVTRIYLKDVNIASTTALQALNPKGRELGLAAGGNILMPIISLPKHRKKYQLYDGKPSLEDSVEQLKNSITEQVAGVGDVVGLGEWGDSPRYQKSR